MTQRQQIYTQLNQLNKELKLSQNRVNYYKQSLDTAVGDKRLFTLAMLPIFYMGWKIIRASGLSVFLKNTLKFAAVSLLAHLRSRFLMSLRKF